MLHHTEDSIAKLAMVPPKQFNIATVWNYKNGRQDRLYTGADNPRPFFFLGALRIEDLFAVGGNDEEFVAPGYDDNWFADCLMKGLGLLPNFLTSVVGYHQDHPRPKGLAKLVEPSRKLYEQKVAAAKAGDIPYCASGGPWELD